MLAHRGDEPLLRQCAGVQVALRDNRPRGVRRAELCTPPVLGPACVTVSLVGQAAVYGRDGLTDM